MCKEPFMLQQIENFKFNENNKRSDNNMLICGDNLEVMKRLYEQHGSFIDLIYIDPPFYSNANYGVKGSGFEFSDKYSHINAYITYLIERIKWMHKVLKDTGSIFVHLDWHAAHYIKVEMDKIFGYDNFLNEIVWCYKSGGASKNYFSQKHDLIYFYSKTKEYTFNPIKEKSYMGEDYNTGNKNVTLFDDGDGKGKYTLVYPKDWWEIGMLATSSKERTGYPTQKSELLVEKIIKYTTNENNLVADFFSGSGTTITVAQKLGRRWIGVDQNPQAIEVASDRIRQISKQKEKVIGIAIPDFAVAMSRGFTKYSANN